MDQQTKSPTDSAQDALALLEAAWAYYTPESPTKTDDKEPELFQYHAAA